MTRCLQSLSSTRWLWCGLGNGAREARRASRKSERGQLRPISTLASFFFEFGQFEFGQFRLRPILGCSPKGGGPNLEKVGPRRVGGPKISRFFFPLSRHCFHSFLPLLGVFHTELVVEVEVDSRVCRRQSVRPVTVGTKGWNRISCQNRLSLTTSWEGGTLPLVPLAPLTSSKESAKAPEDVRPPAGPSNLDASLQNVGTPSQLPEPARSALSRTTNTRQLRRQG